MFSLIYVYGCSFDEGHNNSLLPYFIDGLCLLLVLGSWAVGYHLGAHRKWALTGGALGLIGAAIVGLVLSILTLSSDLFAVALTIGPWIWAWSLVAFYIGVPYSRAVQGGWWGGTLGPIGLLIFLAVTIIQAKNSSRKE
jgi:hypothetical protein